MGYIFGGSGGGGAPTGAAGGDLGGTYPNPTVTAVEAGVVTNAMVNTSAAIAKSKLAALAIADADVASAAAIAYSKLNLASSIVTGDIVDATITGTDIASSIALAGSPTTTTQAAQDASTKIATTVYADRGMDSYQERKQRGFLAWNGPPHNVVAGTVLVSQSLYVIRIPVLETISVTNICVIVTTAGSSLTSNQNLITLYNQAGTKQADAADQSAVWTTAGYYVKPVTGGPFSITGGPTSYCWVSVLSNGSTPATFARNSSNTNGVNAGGSALLTTTAMWAARNGTAVTSTTDLTLSSNVNTNAIDIWVGLS